MKIIPFISFNGPASIAVIIENLEEFENGPRLIRRSLFDSPFSSGTKREIIRQVQEKRVEGADLPHAYLFAPQKNIAHAGSWEFLEQLNLMYTMSMEPDRSINGHTVTAIKWDLERA